MRRKPALFLFLLVLLLSIGAAFLHHQTRKDELPTVAEVDSFLRKLPTPDGWRYGRRSPAFPFFRYNPSDWRYRLGLTSETRYEQVNYDYLHEATKTETNITIWQTDGRVHRVFLGTPPPDYKAFLAFQNAISAKFPGISNNRGELPGTVEFR